MEVFPVDLLWEILPQHALWEYLPQQALWENNNDYRNLFYSRPGVFPQALWEHTKAAPLSSFNLVTAVYWGVDLLNIIETVNEGNKQEGEGVAAMALMALFNFFSPVPTSQQSGNVLRR